jgi:hypothetical protein
LDNVLNLRGLQGAYKKTNKDKRIEVFHNTYNGNTILFLPYGEECDMDSICNGIRNEMYFYLIGTLNNYRDITVLWSQVEGTTSDYEIYYDLKLEQSELKSHNRVINILQGQLKNGELSNMKYTEVKKGKVIPINL